MKRKFCQKITFNNVEFFACGKVITYLAMSDNNSLIKLYICNFQENFFYLFI